MKGEERRDRIIAILQDSKKPVSGAALAQELEVSRQVIVQDIALIRARDREILSTNRGYIINKPRECTRILKVIHSEAEVETELNTVVDLGGWVRDVFVYHKVYGVIRADMNIHSRRDIMQYKKDLADGTSTLLMKVTSGYHYHTIVADTQYTLNLIQDELGRLGFLARLKDYEPVDFWKEEKRVD